MLSLVAALAAAAAIGAPSVVADAPLWSEPQQVSTALPHIKDWFPAVAADEQGVHIIWNAADTTETPDAWGELKYVRWNGETWTAANDIATDWAGAALRNSIAVDANGRLHMVYLGYGRLDRDQSGLGPAAPQDLWYTSADGNNAQSVTAWSRPVRITRSGQGYFSDIAVDSHGVIHVLWTENDGAGHWGIFYSHSTDGGVTWSERVPLESNGSVWWYRAHLVVDQMDRLHAVWELITQSLGGESLGFGTTAGAVYALSTDGGSTWSKTSFPGSPMRSTTLNDPTPGPGPQQPAVGVDGNGTILLVYREAGTNRVLYRESLDGRRWSIPAPVSGIAAPVARPYDVYNMATDSVGHVHLVAVGYPSGSQQMSVLHSEWDGQRWGSPDVIASAPPYPEYPKLAIGSGNRLHVVWFMGDKKTTDRDPIGVWYSTATLRIPASPLRGAAPVPAMAAGAVVPTAATVPPTALPAAPKSPVGAPQAEAAPSGWLADMQDERILPLLLGVLPVTLLLAGIFAVRFLAGRRSARADYP